MKMERVDVYQCYRKARDGDVRYEQLLKDTVENLGGPGEGSSLDECWRWIGHAMAEMSEKSINLEMNHLRKIKKAEYNAMLKESK